MHLAKDKADWVVGFEDECWWSRVRQPNLHSFTEAGEPLRLVEQSVEKDEPDPKAISCYGLYMPELKETWLRFRGRPSGERYKHALFGVVLPEAYSHRQEGVGVDLGQRKLAHKPRGSPLDR